MTGARPYSLLLMAGVVALAAGTFLHPMHEDPNDAVRAFAEYAADKNWLASHLVQLSGVIFMVLGLIGMLHKAGCDGALKLICAALGASVIAVSAALQAVDGIALKFMVDRWAAAALADKDALFNAAYAVRMIEIGLAAIASLMTGVTVLAASIAFFQADFGSVFLLVTGLLAGALFAASAWVIGSSGFSALAMSINMSAGIMLMAWILLAALTGTRLNQGQRGEQA